MPRLHPTIVDEYLANGCGRCPLGGTLDCKVHNWDDELAELRKILLETDLTEEVKWMVPCYTYDGNNVLIMSAFKEYCSIDFFKGVLLKDEDGVLIQPTPNSQASRHLRFTNVEDIHKLKSTIKAYVAEAIEIEKAGLKVELKKTSDYDVPEELEQKFDEDPAFKSAFEALTPGRQRGYLLHFAGAKQSKTRLSRIEKCTEDIFAGKGFYDRD